MGRLCLAVLVVSVLAWPTTTIAQVVYAPKTLPIANEANPPVVDFEKQDLAEKVLQIAERQMGDRPFDATFRARVMKQLLGKSSQELLKLQSDALTPVLNALDGATGDLTYTPLPAPCRIYDSRLGSGLQGDGTGPLPTGTAVAIYVTGRCAIPFPAAKAVTMNFVAAAPSGVGNLRSWPWDSTAPAAPNASIVNYTAGMNLANGLVVQLCNTATATGGNCSKDIFIQPFNHSTDVVIDVLGYFAAPARRPLQMANQSIPFSVAPQGYFLTSTPACPAGYTLVGGGLMYSQLPIGDEGGIVHASGEFPANAWRCAGFNNQPAGGTTWTGTCTAYCARTP